MPSTAIYVLAGQSNAKGSENFVARELASRDPDAQLVTVAVGGRTLAQKAKGDWNINSKDELYDELILEIQSLTNSINAQGGQPEIKGLFWIQGEADSANVAAAQDYQENLQDLVEAVYTDIEGSDFPFVIAELRTTAEKLPYHEEIREAQHSVAQSNSSVVLLETENFDLSDDGVHYSASGKQDLAKALFESVEKLNTPEIICDSIQDISDDIEDLGGADIALLDDTTSPETLESQLGTSCVDIIYGNSNDDTIRAFDGNDTIYGMDGDDRIKGGNGDDVLFGGAGNDKLIGGNGNNKLVGDDGSDSFVFKKTAVVNNLDTIMDFESGIDKIILRNLTMESVESIDGDLYLHFESGDKIAILNHAIEDLSTDDFRLQNDSSLDGFF